MSVTLMDLQIGDKVQVRDAWGRGPILTGIVEGMDEDIKNGEPGIDYKLPDGTGKWCYLYQVIGKV